MKFHSFRSRIALLSTVLAGSALVAFSAVAWQLIYAAKVNRLDARLESQVIRATRPRFENRWQAFEATLPRQLGTEADTPIALLVLDTTGKTLYRSQNWSSDLPLHPLVSLSQMPAHKLPDLAPSPALPLDSLPPSEPPLPSSNTDLNHLADGSLPKPHIITVSTATGSWRVGAVNFPPAQAVIAVSLDAIDQEMTGMRNIFLGLISGTLLLVAGGAWILSGQALLPIHKLTTAIRQVTVTGLDQQVPIGTTDVEFVELIQVFNQMLERLGRSFGQASRFSADAAHELKTPLAILQGELEQALQQAEPGSTLQQNLSNLLDEVSRLSSIVRKLLLLSLADAGQISLHPVHVNLSHLLEVIVEDIDLLAPDLTVELDVNSDLYVFGDLDLLTQVLQNLISNAVKYNLPQGWIHIIGYQSLNQVKITITNASSSLTQLDRDRIFDRFYRGDPARTRKIEGIGLGLSLSREIVRAHQGELRLDAAPDGQTAFTLSLPIEQSV